MRREISPYPYSFQDCDGASLLPSLARGPLVDDNPRISKGASGLAALCLGRGRELLGALGLSCCLLAGASGAGGAAFSPDLARQDRFARALRDISRWEKKHGRGLITPSCLQPRQFRGREQDLNHLPVSAAGTCGVITPTQFKIPSLPQSRAASRPLPRRGVPAGSRLSPPRPEPFPARSEWICNFISLAQDSRVCIRM